MLREKGTVECWGSNGDRQLGSLTDGGIHTGSIASGNPGAVFAPIALPGVQQATAIAAGSAQTCALLTGGTVECWGGEGTGQPPGATSGFVRGVTGATALAAGGSNTCALLSNGTVNCWGRNESGQLGPMGVATTDGGPFVVSGIASATAIAVGGSAYGHACALLSDGTVSCWGNNRDGELGNGSSSGTSPTPTPVVGLTGATRIAAGGSYTCALVSGGAVKCWGSNQFGELGDGSTTSRTVPVAVAGISGAVEIVAAGSSISEAHACALLSDGTVKCWGANGSGELGIGSKEGPVTCGGAQTACSPTPVTVAGIASATTLAAGGFPSSGLVGHTCALLADGSVKCWGSNKYGELGNGDTTPIPVSGVNGVNALASKAFETCATVTGGTVKCWGLNKSGQLGNGSTTDAFAPAAISALNGVTTLGVGTACACAGSGGVVSCWGAITGNALGAGTPSSQSSTPTKVSGLTTAQIVVAGTGGGCVLLSGGTVDCWGDNSYGVLGNGTTAQQSGPTATTVCWNLR